MPILANSRQKSITIAIAKKKVGVGLITSTFISTYPENLVKDGPVYSKPFLAVPIEYWTGTAAWRSGSVVGLDQRS